MTSPISNILIIRAWRIEIFSVPKADVSEPHAKIKYIKKNYHWRSLVSLKRERKRTLKELGRPVISCGNSFCEVEIAAPNRKQN